MAGLLEFIQTPAGQGLLSGIASYAMNARRGTPVNNIGRGLAGGLVGYQGAQDAIKQEQENALTRQYKQMQMQELESKIAQQKAQQEWKAGLPQMMEQAKTKVTQFEADDPFNEGAATFGEGYGGQGHGQQVGAGMANVQQGNPQALQDYLMQPDSPYADKLIEQQLKPEEYGTTPFVDAEGNAQLIGKTGTTKTLPFKGAPKEGASPYGQDLREWFAVNGIDPRTASPQQLLAGYNATNQTKDKRARLGGVNIGQLGPKYTEGVDKLGAQYLFEQFGEARNAATAVSAVNDAKVLLDQGMFTGKAGPWQESAAGWYQAATGRPMPKLDATQQFKTVIGDIVLPALASLKGASSDRDFKKIEEYSRGEETMTEGALKNHLDRLFNKYGAQINNFNATLDDYQKSGGGAIPGLRRLETPAGNIKPRKTPANGQTGKSKSGRPIIFRNGQWEYQ